MKKTLRWLIVLILVLLALPFIYRNVSRETVDIAGYEVKSQKSKKDSFSDVDEIIDVVHRNAKAVNDKDVDAYLDTIVSSAAEDTAKQLEESFKTYNLEIEINEIELVDQTDDLTIIRINQTTRNKGDDDEDEDEKYKDHVAIMGISLKKEDGKWKIAESIAEDTFFID